MSHAGESQGSRRAAAMTLALLGQALAQEAPVQVPKGKLEDLSLEELGSLEVTSVSKRPQKWGEAAASIYVITGEDIRRAGAVNLAEALRLAPNLQVARVDASQYAIGAGGFNINNVNKMLVLIDGRSVYSPINAGVFWDAQEVSLQDIERIEVIRGPGGALWGSNAVNGVINVITRSAKESQGTELSAARGDEVRTLGAGRHGGRLSENAYYRIYGRYLDVDASVKANGASSFDDWHRAQVGFRVDWAQAADTLTLQGDAYKGLVNQAAGSDKRLKGANLLARWSHEGSPDSSLQAQLYIDRAQRDLPSVYLNQESVFSDTLDTVDLDIHHRFKVGSRHEIVWGGGYRSSHDRVVNPAIFAFMPARKDLRLLNVFAQESVALAPERLTLTLGVKFEHNVYTGWETQPSLRLAWRIDEGRMLWMAASRAVRTPSRVDSEFNVNLPGILVLNGNPAFRSETVVSYEAGYRAQPGPRAAFSLSTFYNVYKHLRTLERTEQILANRAEGESYGGEAWGEIHVADAWRLKPGYAYQRTSYRLLPGSSDPSGSAGVGNDARHRFLLTSLWKPAAQLEFDGTLRHVSALPNPAVPAYWALDLRLGWRPLPRLEIALIGQNLLDKQHPEFGPATNRKEFEQGAMVRLTWAF